MKLEFGYLVCLFCCTCVFQSAKPPPEKKKKVGTAASQHSAISDRLVYLTGIPKDASEEEVTSLVGSFGKINNVILLPASGEQSDKDEGQKVHCYSLMICLLFSLDEYR